MRRGPRTLSLILAIATATAVSAFWFGRPPGRCVEVALAICRVRIGHPGCLPGPCELARHHAAIRRELILLAGCGLALAVLVVRLARVRKTRHPEAPFSG